jgi:hypothetical protein
VAFCPAPRDRKCEANHRPPANTGLQKVTRKITAVRGRADPLATISSFRKANFSRILECDRSRECSMQMNLRYATPNERKVIRTWHLRVVLFYGSLCVILLLLSFVSDRTAPPDAGAQTSISRDALAAR